jgi:putative hydrolase
MNDALAPGIATNVELKLLPWVQVDRSFAVDYHMHTTYTDGTASAEQMAEAAVLKGIKEILFSEHVRHTSTYYPEFVEVVRKLHGPQLSVRAGIETKVLNVAGVLDCSPKTASLCDAIVGTVHSPPADDKGQAGSWTQFDAAGALELEFALAMAIVTKSRAHILGHPMGMAVTRFGLTPVEQIYQLACACRDFDKAFELNTRYCASPSDWIDAVRKAGCRVSFGSDAHRTEDVGSAWYLFNQEGPALQGPTPQ